MLLAAFFAVLHSEVHHSYGHGRPTLYAAGGDTSGLLSHAGGNDPYLGQCPTSGLALVSLPFA